MTTQVAGKPAGMLLGFVIGCAAAWEINQASDIELHQAVSPSLAGWGLAVGAVLLLLLFAVAGPNFSKAFAPCIAGSVGWAAYRVGQAGDVTALWPMVVVSVSAFAALQLARMQRVVPSRPSSNSARVVRDFLGTYHAR